MSLQEIALIITIVTFLFGIVSYLFKKIVIEPLQISIDLLNKSITELRQMTGNQITILRKEVDTLQRTAVKHEEQLKTLFRWKRNE